MEDRMKEIIYNYEAMQKALLEARWAVGFNDRGMGAGDFAVITDGGDYRVDFTCPECGVVEQDIKDGETQCGSCTYTIEDTEGLELVKNPGGELVVKCPSKEIAEHIVFHHNRAVELEKFVDKVVDK